jgi:hypothetical protein
MLFLSEMESSTLLPFRQRAPFAGLFIAASLGVLASDQQPSWRPASIWMRTTL